MNSAIIGIGSNIEPGANVEAAVELVAGRCRLAARSDLVWTDPIGIADQPRFLNGAILIETELALDALKEFLHQVEDSLGRVRGGPRFGPRTIDLDVLVFNGQVIHPDVAARPFVRDAVEQLWRARGGQR
jgi:2-amino-4-hydroxy-6-hydroxymethyldihydropteridine diphosphokinase